MTLAVSSPQQFTTDLLAGIAGATGKPTSALETPGNQQAVLAWYQSEGGNWHNTASYNPLNTSLELPGSVNYGTRRPGGGVQAYSSWDQGLSATLDTLLGSSPSYGYGSIVSDLANNAPPEQTAQAINESSWNPGGYSPSSPIGTLAGGGSPAALTSAPGGNWDPLNWGPAGVGAVAAPITGAVGQAVTGALGSVVGAVTAPLKAYLEDAALVVLGVVAILVGLVVFAHALGSGGGAPASAPRAGSSAESEGAEAAEVAAA